MTTNTPQIIGRIERVDVIGHANDVQAKIDTGADSSAIWASSIFIDQEHRLHFKLFDIGSPHYTGRHLVRKSFKVARVRSSSGHIQIRYQVQMPLRISGRRVRVLLNLSDRSNNQFPILIGRRTIAGKFLVDVTKGKRHKKLLNKSELNAELQKNPRAFFEKYHVNKG